MLFSGATSGGGGGGVGEATLTTWTIEEKSGSGQTNIPIQIPVPVSATALPDTSCYKVYDSDGTTVLSCQEDNRARDNDTQVDRFGFVTALLPSLTANEKRQLTIKAAASTSPTAGTPITAAEIIATGYDCVLSIVSHDGVTYTASAAAALAASTWTNKTTACNFGKWLGRGSSQGLVDSFIVTAPFKNGGTPMPGNLCAFFDVSAFKANRAAVSGGNPIIGVQTFWWTEGANCDDSAGTDWWYDITATSGSNTQSFVGSSPSKTLTLSGNSTGSNVTASVPSGGTTFTIDSIGKVIDDGTSNAVIIGYTDANTVTVRINWATPMSGTTIASGNWKIYGVNHPYTAAFPMQEIWYGGALAITAKPNIESYLGAAWSDGTLTGGPASYFISTGMLLDYAQPASGITNSPYSQGSNPTGWILVGDERRAGGVLMGMPQTGGRADIAPVPGWDVNGIIRYDANGRAAMDAAATASALVTINYRDASTGKTMTMNNGLDYVTSAPLGTPVLPSKLGLNQWEPQKAHFPNLYLMPYLRTGRFFYLDRMQKKVFWLWAGVNTGYNGHQLSRTFCIDNEERGVGWTFRCLMQACLFTPNDSPAVLGMSKSHLLTAYTNQFTATNGLLFDGINVSYINNTGPGKTWATVGPRCNVVADHVAQWQCGYMMIQFFNNVRQGMGDANLLAYMDWNLTGLTSAVTSTDVNPYWCVPSYKVRLTDNAGAPITDWPTVWHCSATDPGGDGLNNRYMNGGAVTLSGLSGSITVTMPTGYFNNGGSFYVDGLIQDRGAASARGTAPNIVSGGSGYATNDIITLTVPDSNGRATATTKMQVKVTGQTGGVITSISIETPGCYTFNTPSNDGSFGGLGNGTSTQFSTTGGGTGATFDGVGDLSLKFGAAIITGVSGNVVTMNTSGTVFAPSGQSVTCYPFARTSIPNDASLRTPAPANGDNVGSITPGSLTAYTPLAGYEEYFDIQRNVMQMANQYSMTDAATALSFINTNYSGGFNSKWWVN